MLLDRVAAYPVQFLLNTIRWLFYETYNSMMAQDVRFLFSSFCSQRLPLSTSVPHPVGVVIPSDSPVGENVNILQNVPIGGNGDGVAPNRRRRYDTQRCGRCGRHR